MNSANCSRKARKYIDAKLRRKLAQHSWFACSICGAIPIVFHHIQEWSKNFSNAEEILIPICDKCHRRIHGEGGNLFSKEELYAHKANPKRPLILSDKLPLEDKRSYSFFIGSNFVSKGVKATFLPVFFQDHNLITVDTSTGKLMLTILAECQDGTAIYLIQNNELMLSTRDIWDMRYTGNSLIIWRIDNDKKTVFIDLVIKPDVIILKKMNTTFDGKPFLIYKPRKPHKGQVDKIRTRVKYYEKLFLDLASQIDKSPNVHGIYKGIDTDAILKKHQKDMLKIDMKQELEFVFRNEFPSWDSRYYYLVLHQVLADSSLFAPSTYFPTSIPEKYKYGFEMIETIKAKYKEEFTQLEGTLIEYNGGAWLGNIQL